jgi:hypothetical protein
MHDLRQSAAISGFSGLRVEIREPESILRTEFQNLDTAKERRKLFLVADGDSVPGNNKAKGGRRSFKLSGRSRLSRFPVFTICKSLKGGLLFVNSTPCSQS